MDFIAILPLPFFFETPLVYLLKTVRLFNGVKMFNIGIILDNIKNRAKEKRELNIKQSPTFAED